MCVESTIAKCVFNCVLTGGCGGACHLARLRLTGLRLPPIFGLTLKVEGSLLGLMIQLIDALCRDINNGRELKRNVIAALRTAAGPFASTQAGFTPFRNVEATAAMNVATRLRQKLGHAASAQAQRHPSKRQDPLRRDFPVQPCVLFGRQR